MYNTYELSQDFRKVTSVFVGEDLEEVKLAYTGHALERMYDTEKRGVEEIEIETLLMKAYDSLLDLSVGDEFVVVTNNMELAVAGVMYSQDFQAVLILKTVIRVEKSDGKFKRLKFDYSNNNIIKVAI